MTSVYFKAAELLGTAVDAMEQAAFIHGLCFSLDHVWGQELTWNLKVWEKTALGGAILISW